MKGLATIVLFSLSLVRGEEPIDFNRDIRPILSENCVHCHGPDEESREAGLRLDTLEGALEDLGGYRALVPNHPEKSELWQRISLDGGDPDVMPPAKSKRSLTSAQKDLLRRWIESGGQYDEHWAYRPPEKPDVPRTGISPIDFFIRNEGSKRGLGPSPRAAPHTLIRRLSLDLIGLPPSPGEVAAFLLAYEKEPEKAYENLVDRLLQSPRFGERWARPWLDLARYADSNGFQADQLRDSWAYRDWVIEAMNANLPFDRFTIEQLAGDLLPEATLQQKIATGFHRTVTCNVEAGVHPEENRTNQVVDRVNTTGTVWLGVTMECAQCHDHKYDPFSMRDYYRLFAYFNNTPLEVSLPTSKNDVSHDFVGPFMDLPQDGETLARRQSLEDELAKLKAEKRQLTSPARIARWEDDRKKEMATRAAWEVAEIGECATTGGESTEILGDRSVLVTGELPKTTTYTVTATSKLETINAIRLEALTHERLPGNGPGRGDPRRTNFVLTEFEFLVDGEKIPLVGARAGFSQQRWDVRGAIDGDNKSGWGIAPEFGKDHWAVFQPARPVSVPKGARLTFVLDQQYRGGRTLGRFRISATSGNPDADDMPEEILVILKKDERSRQETAKLKQYFEKTDPDMAALTRRENRLGKELENLKPDQTLVMEEIASPRMTHIMNRGNYLDRGAEVSPGIPAIFPSSSGLSERLPPNRLGLATWLVSRDNPLVARVAVNRWWAEIFGRGIVATLEDFGTQSEPPTHPRLLDWLAVELMDSGWNRKHLIRQIVLSETYRQSSVVRPEDRKKDPDNRYLARGARFRLDAERIRDNALAVSGLLSTKMFGRPVMPYQPPNIWRQVGRNEPKWIESKTEDRWRRGIYIVYRRAAPYPSLVNFDAPDRGACTVQRPRTNTPLQALTLLNDPAYVEMALALADRVLVESPSEDTDSRIDYAFQLALSRSAETRETAVLKEVLSERLDSFHEDPAAAKLLLSNASEVYRRRHSDEAELAAWFHLANILLNLDEMIAKS